MSDAVSKAVDYVRARSTTQPRVMLVLGSGLGGLADEMDDAIRIPFGEIPGFHASSVVGHKGMLVVGKLEGVEAIAMQGRFHLYEGHSAATAALPVRVMAALGARTLIISNAAGGLNAELRPGDLMIMDDHINFMWGNPLIGAVVEGDQRFPDMSAPYDVELIAIAERVARENGIAPKRGVYFAVTGPSYETPAEIRMYARLGADAVGMSTVPEVIAARAMGVRVLGISLITNAAAGMTGEPLAHEEVLVAGEEARPRFAALVRGVVRAASVLSLAAMTLLGACREKPRDEVAGGLKADTGGTVVVALATDIDYANGLLSNEGYSQEINRHLFLPLVQYDEKLNIAPLLATSWQIEGDTAVVLNLRNDVKWHDGVKTTAHDVEFTYRYGKDTETGYPNADYWEGWNGAQVLDSFRIRFSISPQPEPLANLAWIPIMPAHLLGSIKPADIKNAPFNQKPVGNGPLKFVEYKPNDRWVFEANRDFPEALGGRPYLDRVIFRVIPDETAQETELTTGNVDVAMKLRAERFKPIDDSPEMRAIARPGRQFGFIGWNGRVPPLNDARVRRALTTAIDRQRLLTVLSGGRGEIAAGPVPSFHYSYDPNIKPLPYSVDSARALFAAAGIQDRNGDGTLDLPNGKPFEIELKLPANNPLNRDMAEMIRSDLATTGVKVVTKPTDFSTLIEDVMSPERKFEAVLFAWVNDFRLVIYDNFHSKSIGNPLQFASYRNAEVDSLLDIVQRTTSREQAAPAWRRLQTIIRDEQPWTFLYAYPTLHGVRERLNNVEMDIRGALVNLPDWWVARQTAEQKN